MADFGDETGQDFLDRSNESIAKLLDLGINNNNKIEEIKIAISPKEWFCDYNKVDSFLSNNLDMIKNDGLVIFKCKDKLDTIINANSLKQAGLSNIQINKNYIYTNKKDLCSFVYDPLAQNTFKNKYKINTKELKTLENAHEKMRKRHKRGKADMADEMSKAFNTRPKVPIKNNKSLDIGAKVLSKF